MRQLLALYLTTPTALLASVLGINSDDRATGSFGLVGKHRVEQSQAHVIGRARQVTIGEHKAKVQLFDGDQGIVLGQPVGGFVPEVFALVGDPQSRLRNRPIPLKRGKPGFPPLLMRRKKAAKLLSRRRSNC